MKFTRFIPLGIVLLLSVPALAQTTSTEEPNGNIRGSLIEDEADASDKAQEEQHRKIRIEAAANGADASRVIIIKNDSVLFNALGPEGAGSFGITVNNAEGEDGRNHVIVKHNNEVLFETFDEKDGGVYHMKVDRPKGANGRAHIIVKKQMKNGDMLLENTDEVEKAMEVIRKEQEQMKIELEKAGTQMQIDMKAQEKAMQELERALEQMEAGKDGALLNGKARRIEIERLAQQSGAGANAEGSLKVRVYEMDTITVADRPEGTHKRVQVERLGANGAPRMYVRVFGDSNCIGRTLVCGNGNAKKMKVQGNGEDVMIITDGPEALSSVSTSTTTVNGAKHNVVVRVNKGEGTKATQVFVFRTDEKENVVAEAAAATDAAIVEKHEQLLLEKTASSGYRLDANVPNPFTGTTTINFTIPSTEHVALTVYNSTGEKVETLKDEEMAAGTHGVLFDASKLPSGMYFYTLTAGDYTATKSMNVTK